MKSRINVGRDNYDTGLVAFAKTIPLQNFTGIQFLIELGSVFFF